MTNRIATLTTLVAVVGFLLPGAALAKTITGRVAGFSPTSLSVLDREIVTVGLDNQTTFSKLITQKPWQEDTSLTAKALRVGGYVVVHVPENHEGVANWVQIATDKPLGNNAPAAAAGATAPATTRYTAEGARHLAEARARRAAPTASESKRPGSVDTAAYSERLAMQGRLAEIGPSDTAAAPVNGEAAMHRAEARARRAAPNASESKRPGSPDTAVHCDRIADRIEKAEGK